MTKVRNQIPSAQTSIKRGLDFIYRVAGTTEGFDSYGNLSVCCFALVGATSSNASLRRLARSRAEKLARRWERAHPCVPTDASADEILKFVLVRYALSRIGLRDIERKAQIRAAVQKFSVDELVGFNPLSESPPSDLSYTCECGLKNERGRTYCRQCRKRLVIQSRYAVWMRALASTYVSDRCGILFGAGYLDVLKWLPAMRPYPFSTNEDIDVLRDAIYAVTHIVYTLNDYGTYRLPPGQLHREFAFLKVNVAGACERKDPEILGELIDSLKAFGLRGNHPLIIRGSRYLLENQNEDGSWGDEHEENIRTRCHTTWTAIDGLRSYAWRGRSRLEVKSMIKAIVR